MGTLPIVDAVSKGGEGKKGKKERPKRTSLSGKLRASPEPPDLKVPGGGSSLCYLEREQATVLPAGNAVFIYMSFEHRGLIK